MLTGVVRAIPANGGNYFRRLGIAWTKSPVKVSVVDEPKRPGTDDPKGRDALAQLVAAGGPVEISPAEWEILSDPSNVYLHAVPTSGDVAEAQSIAALKAQIANLAEQKAKLERELAGAREEDEARGKRYADEMAETGAKIRALESENANLRGKLAAASERRGKP